MHQRQNVPKIRIRRHDGIFGTERENTSFFQKIESTAPYNTNPDTNERETIDRPNERNFENKATTPRHVWVITQQKNYIFLS